MRVGINALLLSSRAGYRRTGVSRYTERLVAALPAEMADDEIADGKDPDVIALAKEIKTSQTAEIETMKTLLAGL